MVLQGEHFPWQITLCYLNNPVHGVIKELTQVLHKGTEWSEWHLLHLPDHFLVGVTPSGYQV